LKSIYTIDFQACCAAKRGGVTGKRIKACLQEFIPEILEGDTFQHDNARTFRAKLVHDWLKKLERREGIFLTDWPPYRPYLNPIENIWMILKKRICDISPEFAAFPVSVEALNLLVEAACELWQEIEEVIQNVIKSMPKRMQDCYEADGYYTKY
jgi:hypothetical protein